MSEVWCIGVDIVVFGFEVEELGKYGCLIVDNDGVFIVIVEVKEVILDQFFVWLCNLGVILVDVQLLFDLFLKVLNDNVKGEYYFIDIVEIGWFEGCNVVVVEC